MGDDDVVSVEGVIAHFFHRASSHCQHSQILCNKVYCKVSGILTECGVPHKHCVRVGHCHCANARCGEGERGVVHRGIRFDDGLVVNIVVGIVVRVANGGDIRVVVVVLFTIDVDGLFSKVAGGSQGNHRCHRCDTQQNKKIHCVSFHKATKSFGGNCYFTHCFTSVTELLTE